MAEGRRHSVDVPISRALVALRRVRSLRDPSTNSMSKFASLLDNLDAANGLSNDISAHFVDGYPEFGSLDQPKSLADQLKESACNYDMYTNRTNPAFMETTCKDLSLISEAITPLSGSDDAEEPDFRCIRRRKDEELDDKCFTPGSNRMEDVDSCNAPSSDPLRELGANYPLSNWRDQYDSEFQSSLKGGDGASRVGGGGASSYMNEELSDVDCDFQGCGLGYCWSRTPRFKSDPPSDLDDQPLLSGEIGDTALCVQAGNWLLNNHELVPFEGSPRSLGQKFRPRTFTELVGQDVVVRSLSQAISSRRLSPLYLFHGPRGTGKTATSRIFAAALNCVSQGEQKPCGSCHHCCSFFSGNSRDVTFVDSVTISEGEKIVRLMSRAVSPPRSSDFKVIVFDECQLLRKDAWATILNRLDTLPQYVVLIMITPDVERLPRSAVSRSQRFHFLKIKDHDISFRLKKICIAEGIQFEQAALDFIAAKSSGSLRDAEMMLEQLSLSGKTISMSLAYEVTGIISDDELLELLDVALSPNTCNTVRMAREMMKSRIDPMQLTSQLANLIMDILAGKFQEDSSDVREKFFKNHTSEADFQRLSHALKILSDTEKQLRVSKNQSTWLTAALLQFSSLESIQDPIDSVPPMRAVGLTNGEFCSTPSTAESLRHLVPCVCDDNSSDKSKNTEKLEIIWTRAIEMCQSNSLRSFLKKHGRLSSVCASQGVVVARLEFWNGKHVTRAENAWKLIASSLQNTLGCNVEIQIHLNKNSHAMKSGKLIKGCFKFLSCYRRSRHKPYSITVHSGQSMSSDLTSEKAVIGEKCIEACGSDSGPQTSHNRCHGTTTTIRDAQGNALRTGWVEPSEASFEDVPVVGPVETIFTTKNEEVDHGDEEYKVEEVEFQAKCINKTVLDDEYGLPRNSQLPSLSENKEAAIPVYKKTSFLVSGNDAAFICSGTDKLGEYADHAEGTRKTSKVRCWKTPSRLKKAWHPRHQQERKRSSMWVLPCASDK
uniref:DNA-directed DNA polymerase n=1 Tax=Kalanchoe fedtschenkoi TaxID=63787 RepID=A0A7N0ZUQ2_KALFE